MKIMNLKIENEDVIFGSLILILLASWFLTLVIFDKPLLSIIFLWTGMIFLSILYAYVYKKKKRDLKILKKRFFVSAIPIYPMLIYYIYKLVIDHNLPQEQKYLPFVIVLSVLILNAIVLYIYEIKNQIK